MQVTREIVLPAAPAEVWEALTRPERLEEWFAGEVELDAEPGGAGRFSWGSGESRRAIVERVDDGEALSLRWWDEEKPEEQTVVTITLEEAEEGTRVVVTETAPRPAACAGEWSFALQARAAFGLEVVC